MLKQKLHYFAKLMGRAKSLEKTLMLGKTEGRRRRMTEAETAGWHHGLDGREPEWTPGVGNGQGGLVCCDSWGCKEVDTIEQLNWTEPSIPEINPTVLLCITDTAGYSVPMRIANTARHSVVIFCMVLVLYQIQRINCGVLFLLTAGVYYIILFLECMAWCFQCRSISN